MRTQFRYILAAIFLFVATAVTAQDIFDELLDKGYNFVIIENDGVRKYIEDRSYDDPKLTGNYSYSIVKKYSKGISSRPAGLKLKWSTETPEEEIKKIVVKLVESDVEKNVSIFNRDLSRENVKYYYPDIDTQEYLLCNMCPDKYCYYSIEEVQQSGQTTVLKRGKFYTVGQVRMLRVDGMANVRDFGGWYTSFGKDVVYGRIFRGNRPEGITAKGKNDFVKNEHITADLDLRGSDLSMSPMGAGVEYYCTNNQRYKLALTSSTKALARDLDIIANVLRKGGSVFLHCNHGANRAGTLSFLIGGILGFSEADLSRDYELSSFAYGSIFRTKKYGEMVPYIRSFGERDDDLAQCFYNYALSIGVSERTLDTLRCVMLGMQPDDPLILEAHR